MLASLSEHRRQFVDEATAVSNRLTAVLKGFFPQALVLSGELNTPMAWAFLKRWPSLQAVKKAKPETLKSFYYKHHSRLPSKMEERLQLIKEAVNLSDDEVGRILWRLWRDRTEYCESKRNSPYAVAATQEVAV
jgi:hypothetical protein